MQGFHIVVSVAVASWHRCCRPDYIEFTLSVLWHLPLHAWYILPLPSSSTMLTLSRMSLSLDVLFVLTSVIINYACTVQRSCSVRTSAIPKSRVVNVRAWIDRHPLPRSRDSRLVCTYFIIEMSVTVVDSVLRSQLWKTETAHLVDVHTWLMFIPGWCSYLVSDELMKLSAHFLPELRRLNRLPAAEGHWLFTRSRLCTCNVIRCKLTACSQWAIQSRKKH